MIDSKNLLQKLIDLDEKAGELDNRLKDVRIEMLNILWDFVELNIKKDKTNKVSFHESVIVDDDKNTGNC